MGNYENLYQEIRNLEKSILSSVVISEEHINHPYRDYPDTHYSIEVIITIDNNRFIDLKKKILKDPLLSSVIPSFFKNYFNLSEFLESLDFIGDSWSYDDKYGDEGASTSKLENFKENVRNEFSDLKRVTKDLVNKEYDVLSKVSNEVPYEITNQILSINYLIHRNDYVLSASSIRTGLQFLIRKYSEIKEKDLNSEINVLFQKHALKFKRKRVFIDDLHLVRNVGNFAIHSESQESITKEEIDLMFESYLKIVDAYFNSVFVEEENNSKVKETSEKFRNNNRKKGD